MSEENENTVVVVDEDGKEIKMEVLDFFTLDDVEYALLLPPEENREADEDTEVIVMRVKRDGEQYYMELVDDDNELEKIAAYLDEIEDEIDD